MQTREGSEWNQMFVEAKNRLLDDAGKLDDARAAGDSAATPETQAWVAAARTFSVAVSHSRGGQERFDPPTDFRVRLAPRP